MQLIALRKGGTKCSSACPYYQESGWVRGMYGVPLKTHCRATMQDVIVDCDVWNPMQIEKLNVTEEQWKAMQKAVHKRAKKERKAYPEDHKEIHAVGCVWTRAKTVHEAIEESSKGKYNARKSANVPERHLFPCRVKKSNEQIVND